MVRSKLQLVYLLGGYYDLVLGIALLFGSRILNDILEIQNEITIFNELTGVFLLAIGYLLVTYASKAEYNIKIGLSSVFIRFTFVILVIFYLLFSELHPLFILFGCTDFLTGMLILVPTITELRTH